MDYFNYKNDCLHAEQVALSTIADEVGTPCYVYSRATVERHWHAFNDAFGEHPHRICYAVKANGNLAVLDILSRLGSGFDIVSAGELRRVLAAGGAAGETIFSGVGKQPWEIREALEAGINSFNIESQGELQKIREIAAETGEVARISVRINPDIDPMTHPYISTGLRENKFGLSADKALEIYQLASQDKNIHISGVACHIGSQLTELAPYRDALDKILRFTRQLEEKGIHVEHIDFGGGLGVRYHNEAPPSPAEYCGALLEQLELFGKRYPVTIEPGRAIMANAGILLTRVHYLKHSAESNFCVVDAAMNDLIRPALYQAYQEIIEVNRSCGNTATAYDIVGPVCESSDFLGKGRRLPVREGDLLAIRTVGAYGAVMSSNYNARPRPAEVMVDGSRFQVVRQRESLESLYAGESRLPD
ncbi:MAG: diaminopimelate decarboxylase [Gammaproteobacteria bacterium]|nr:diaminopimelate decarboxylase [Gammaproteobacteria bacterium]